MGKRRTTWRVGGILLAVCGIVRLGAAQMAGSAMATQTLIDVLWGLGILVFAIGLRPEGSVVARRPLGLTALIVVALAPLVVNISYVLAPVQVVSSEPSTAWMAFAVSWTGSAVSIAAGVIAAMQIARLGAVPAQWRWAPLWALAISVGSAVLVQIVWVALGAAGADQSVLVAAGMIGWIGPLAPTLGLGIVALIAAATDRPQSVEIFRSS
ncbi:hypothetical protein M3D75_09740 [Microbacterium enclense]|uniref:hypothetical protein n=1 Tax=Microbacterium enclense TaxID=993073 RepID=UPI0021A922B5|nr:hypothetical protein [Microbacterium enclense]MCT2086392.1 hypothetical protein [Microbacterium enclense]